MQDAFSLTEVMVAVALISVVVSSFYVSLSASFSILESARQNLRATQILVERTETIRLLKWSQVIEEGFVPASFQETYAPNDSDSIKYFGTISLEPLGGSENYAEGMRQAKIELRWRTGNILRKRTMQTLISREGIQNYVF